MKTLKTISLSIVSLLLLLNTACEKEEATTVEDALNTDQISKNSIEFEEKAEDYLYYLDDMPVNENDIDFETGSQYIMIDAVEIDGIQFPAVYAYSNVEGFIQYGEDHDYKIEELVAYEAHMQQYAEESGAIEEYEVTGTVPESYLAYQLEKYHEYFGAPELKSTSATASKAAAGLVNVYLNSYCSGTKKLIYHVAFSLKGSWKNSISSLKPLGLPTDLGFVSLYDKPFFKKRMTTIGTVALMCYNLHSGIDNRTQSLIAV